nr:pilus assembly PilX N-terminal domain-containing protein [uncultured Desulfuromonas sp.]
MMKNFSSEKGFALIVALLMLFVAAVLGIMVMNSSDVGIQLSGAQQRYEQAFTISEGASNTEGTILDKDLTVDYSGETYTRRYVVTDPGRRNHVVSPEVGHAAFNPYSDITTVPDAGTSAVADDIETWPADRLAADTDDQAYRYYALYQNWDTVRKGYDSTTKGEMCEYRFQLQAANWNTATQSSNTAIETGNYRIGTKPTN